MKTPNKNRGTRKKLKSGNNAQVNGLMYRLLTREPFKIPKKGQQISLKHSLFSVRAEIAFRGKRIENTIKRPFTALFTFAEKSELLIHGARVCLHYIAFYHKCLIKYLRMFEPVDAPINEILGHNIQSNSILKIDKHNSTKSIDGDHSFSIALIQEINQLNAGTDIISNADAMRRFNKLLENHNALKEENKINLEFFIDEFYICILNTLRLMGVSYYFSGLQKQGYCMLQKAVDISLRLVSTKNRDILKNIIKVYLYFAKVQQEKGDVKSALDLYEYVIELNRRQIGLILESEINNDPRGLKNVSKLREAVTYLIITILNVVNIQMRVGDIDESIMYLELGAWFSKRFLNPNSEIYQELIYFKERFDKRFKSLYLARKEMQRILIITSKMYDIKTDTFHESRQENVSKNQFYPDPDLNFKIVANKKMLKNSSSRKTGIVLLNRAMSAPQIKRKASKLLQPGFTIKGQLNEYLDDIDFGDQENHFQKNVEFDSDKQTAMKQFFLNHEDYRKRPNQNKEMQVNTLKEFFFISSLKEDEKIKNNLIPPEAKAEFTGYTNKEELEKKRLLFEAGQEPSEVDPYFKSKVRKAIRRDKVRITSISSLKDKAINRKYIEEVDGFELSKLKQFLHNNKIFAHEQLASANSQSPQFDYYLELLRELQKGTDEPKIYKMKTILKQQKIFREKTKSIDQLPRQQSLKNSPRVKWRKAVTVNSSFVIKKDLLSLLKKHPEIFATSNIESTKKKLWEERMNHKSLNNEGKATSVYLSKKQQKIKNICLDPRKGPVDPLVNYKNTKDQITDKMTEYFKENEELEVVDKKQRRQPINSRITGINNSKKKIRGEGIKPTGKFAQSKSLAMTMEKISMLKDLGSKITTFDELINMMKEVNKFKLRIDDPRFKNRKRSFAGKFNLM